MFGIALPCRRVVSFASVCPRFFAERMWRRVRCSWLSVGLFILVHVHACFLCFFVFVVCPVCLSVCPLPLCPSQAAPFRSGPPLPLSPLSLCPLFLVFLSLLFCALFRSVLVLFFLDSCLGLVFCYSFCLVRVMLFFLIPYVGRCYVNVLL